MKEDNKSQKIYKIIMLIVLTAVISALVTSISIYNALGGVSSLNSKTTTTGNSSGPNSSLVATLNEFESILSQKYIGQINEESMINGAIKGYVEGLGDKYTEYLTKEEMSSLEENTNSKYVGIGVYVANNTANNTIIVYGVMNGSPAFEAGMKAGDIIKRIDGVEYTGEELTSATSVLKGEEGTTVKVMVVRDDEEIELSIIRKTITIDHVASKTLTNNIGYIQIDAFDSGVAEAFEEQLNTLLDNNIKGLIIDLRSNGGGIVDESTDIADLFTKKGDALLITQDKNNNEEITKAKKDKVVNDIPVIVLVNGSTASASEILTGALKDNYGATVVGNTTYGKGVIQTVYKLTDGSGLKITTEEYYTPKHTAINNVGITPDYEVNLTKDSSGNYETSESTDAQLLKAIDVINK